MNNKGFMMAEVVVVSSIIIVALVGLYASYNKIFSIYNQRIDYYDVSTLYELAYIRDTNTLTEDMISINTPIVVNGNDKVYFVNKNNISNMNVANQIFKDYLSFLSTSLETDEITYDNLLIMENCTDIDNCKYAYLEVPNE